MQWCTVMCQWILFVVVMVTRQLWNSFFLLLLKKKIFVNIYFPHFCMVDSWIFCPFPRVVGYFVCGTLRFALRRNDARSKKQCYFWINCQSWIQRLMSIVCVLYIIYQTLRSFLRKFPLSSLSVCLYVCVSLCISNDLGVCRILGAKRLFGLVIKMNT